MNNFNFYNPTRIVFGKDTISKLARLVPQGAKTLLIYGGGSIKQNGVYDQVIKALEGREVLEFCGIEPNPHFETCMSCVDFIKKNDIDFLLPVGGGSVIDATKFIAAARYYEEDAWQILETGGTCVKKSMPFGSVLTLPATGSEMNNGAVITKDSTKEKRAFNTEFSFPVFSILDPQTTYSLPLKQVSNGIVDTYVHVMEQYCTYPVNNHIMDRFAEGILLTLIEDAPKVFADPNDYDTRANLMWAATMGLNNLLKCGVPQDWSTHMIGHELTALHGLDHGVTLAIVLPGVLRVMQEEKAEKILQYGERVFGIKEGSTQERIDKTIKATEDFFISVNIPTKLSDVNLDQRCIEPVVKRMEERGWKLGERGTITAEKVREILKDRL